jgi:hypothetical protein
MKATPDNEPAPSRIGIHRQIMTISVQFHDQHPAPAHEIADIRAGRHLSAEFMAIQFAG